MSTTQVPHSKPASHISQCNSLQYTGICYLKAHLHRSISGNRACNSHGTVAPRIPGPCSTVEQTLLSWLSSSNTHPSYCGVCKRRFQHLRDSAYCDYVHFASTRSYHIRFKSVLFYLRMKLLSGLHVSCSCTSMKSRNQHIGTYLASVVARLC